MKNSNRFLLGVAAVGLFAAGWWARSPVPVGSRPRDAAASTRPAGDDGAPRILYYRNPMGLADRSPVPKKDGMGMDYVPVYASASSDSNAVHIDVQKVQKLGVRTEPIRARILAKTLRIVGTIQPDERRQTTVSPKFEGWITRLMVDTTGASVHRGQPLLEVYSPDLVSAQEDYRVAARALQALGDGDAAARESMRGLVASALARLANWDIAEADLADLRAGGPARRNLVLRAPRDGVVSEKMARVGLRFMPGDPLYQLTDYASVWLIGSVFEQDLALIKLGATVTATVVAYPGETFTGTVTFISPVLQAETRSAQIRVELANHAGRLKPAMYGSLDLSAGSAVPALAVPDSAVLDSGTRQLVLIDLGGGAFEPRTVRLGRHADGYTEVLAGVAPGESVVVDGNFLIDAESNLRAALGGLASRGPGAPPPVPGASPAAHAGH